MSSPATITQTLKVAKSAKAVTLTRDELQWVKASYSLRRMLCTSWSTLITQLLLRRLPRMWPSWPSESGAA